MRRTMALPMSVAAAVIVGVVLLRPVLLAPVTGDDVHYAQRAAADPQRTVLTELAGLPEEYHDRVANGRVNVLTAIERRTSGRAMVEAAVVTGRPVHQVLAVFRVGYALLSLFAIYALLRAIRWRRRGSGALVQMESRTRTLAMVAGGLTFAAGAQPQVVGLHGWNGWVSYPVSTWTAAFSIFGVVALALWLARLTAVRGWRLGVPAALLLAVIGALANYRYELTFAALPLTLIALALLPVSDREHRTAGRRAKWLMGCAYLAGFVPLFVANRMMLSDVCDQGGCYGGVRLALEPTALQTFGINVVSSIPGTGVEEIQELLRSESVPTDGAWTPTIWSVLVALALLATLTLAWLGAGRHRADGAAEPDETRAQALLCVVGAALLVLGGLGAAAIMALSGRTPGIGILHRHSVVTWTALAFGLVLLVLAVGLWRPRLAAPSFVALGLVLALLVATKMPADERTMVANHARMKPTTQVFAEVVRGEVSDRANERRCQILRDVDREMSTLYAENIRRSSKRVFERYWHTPFCVRP